MLRPRHVVSAAVAGLALTASPGVVSANGRFPAANHLVAQPGHPARLVLRATFGFLFSEDRGATWDWVCEQAIGYSGIQDPAIAVLAGGRVAAALFDGLAVSDPSGCGWALSGGELTKQVVVDVATRPDAPRRAVAITGTNAGATPDGGSVFRSLVFATEDDGLTWSRLGTAIDPSAIVETIDVAASDPRRLYVSAILDATSGPPSGVLYVSSDAGESWTARSIALEPLERAPFIAAIDPVNADRLYVRTSGNASSRLLVSDDAGRTFRAVWSGGRMLGFALSPDGAKIYLGGQTDGLFVGARDALVFEKRNSVQIECLMAEGTRLYACSNEANHFTLGASEDDGTTFMPLLHLDTVRAPLACPAATRAGAVCPAAWPALRDQLGIPVDAGLPADAAAAVPAAPERSGCSTTGPGSASGGGDAERLLEAAGLAALLGGTALIARATRRRRSG